jgi:hypothetical protein
MLRVDHPDNPAAPLTIPTAAPPTRAPAAARSFDRVAGRDQRATTPGATARTTADRSPRGGAPAAPERPPARARAVRSGSNNDDGVGGTGPGAEPLAAAPWLRPEGALRPEPSSHGPRLAPAPPPLAAPGDRVLFGVGAHRGEARICIGHGPLAGAEIHLRQGPAGIHAVVLTALQSSRKTLSVAMLEVARRLARRGRHFHAAACEEGVDHPWTRGG